MKKNSWKRMLVSAAVVIMLVIFFAISAIAGEQVIYTVKQGDTLGELMYAWRVQGVEIEKLYSWNPGLGTQVKVGQEIVYYLPDRQDDISEQEIKKIIGEVKDGLIAQKDLIDQTGRMLESAKADMEAAKIPALVAKPAVQVEVSRSNRVAELLLISLIIVFVAMGPVVTLIYVRRMRRAKVKTPNLDRFPKTHLSEKPVRVVIGGQAYEFYPEITEDGRFKTFYEIKPGRYLFVGTEKELRKSFKTSFRHNVDLVHGLISQSRLKPIS